MRIGLYLILGICFFGCAKTEFSFEEGDVFIFGDNYGFCMGDCAHFYKLEPGKIYADKEVNNFNLDGLSFHDDPLGMEAYQLAKVLVDNFPLQLWNENEAVLGIPDAYDQGGIYIMYTRDGEERSWYIDNDRMNLPVYLRPYILEMQEVLQQLR